MADLGSADTDTTAPMSAGDGDNACNHSPRCSSCAFCLASTVRASVSARPARSSAVIAELLDVLQVDVVSVADTTRYGRRSTSPPSVIPAASHCTAPVWGTNASWWPNRCSTAVFRRTPPSRLCGELSLRASLSRSRRCESWRAILVYGPLRAGHRRGGATNAARGRSLMTGSSTSPTAPHASDGWTTSPRPRPLCCRSPVPRGHRARRHRAQRLVRRQRAGAVDTHRRHRFGTDRRTAIAAVTATKMRWR